MSRFRLVAKVRTNAGFKAMTRFLQDQGLHYEVEKPNRKGHPALRITAPAGRQIDHKISCTPGPREDTALKVAALRRHLRAEGLMPD